MSQRPSATAELESVRERRQALERALAIAASIERLQQGLEAAVLLGRPGTAIDPAILRKFGELDARTRGLPSPKLEQALRRLEAQVREQVGSILELSRADDEALARSPATTAALLRGFRRAAHTAVAVRLLLRTRGVDAPATPLGIPAADLSRAARALGHREQACRQRVRREIVRLLTDTSRLLRRTDLPAAAVDMLQAMRAGLRQNLRMLDRGEAIEDLPATVEIVELTGEEQAPAASPRPAPGRPDDPGAGPAAAPRPGFLRRLWRWLNTPIGVRWKDL